jgi:hypothetical protein
VLRSRNQWFPLRLRVLQSSDLKSVSAPITVGNSEQNFFILRNHIGNNLSNKQQIKILSLQYSHVKLKLRCGAPVSDPEPKLYNSSCQKFRLFAAPAHWVLKSVSDPDAHKFVFRIRAVCKMRICIQSLRYVSVFL